MSRCIAASLHWSAVPSLYEYTATALEYQKVFVRAIILWKDSNDFVWLAAVPPWHITCCHFCRKCILHGYTATLLLYAYRFHSRFLHCAPMLHESMTLLHGCATSLLCDFVVRILYQWHNEFSCSHLLQRTDLTDYLDHRVVLASTICSRLISQWTTVFEQPFF